MKVEGVMSKFFFSQRLLDLEVAKRLNG